jgi:hypothetical protein
MLVHRATCSCSVELYKLWYTSVDFLTNWDISRGFLYVCIIYIAGRISAAVMAGDIIFLSLAGPVGYYTGNIIYQSFGGPWSIGKIHVPGIPSSGLKRSILCLEISRGFLCIFCRRDQRSCDGWAA